MTGITDNTIKVGFCVAYDWRLLAYALPSIYNRADIIYLAIDRDRISWAQKPFDWDTAAFDHLIRSIDVSNKVVLYEDDFHLADLSPAENEVRQRRMMAAKMGEGGWHIQLDCDEYFLDFAGFADFLEALPRHTYNFNVCCQWITLFKEVQNGFLYVYPSEEGQMEFMPMATRTPCYEHGRTNGYFNIISPFLVVHQSWARSESEILDKLSNWGHVRDFDVRRYFDFWMNVNADNYPDVRNFHPIRPLTWPSLRFIEARNIQELIERFRLKPFPTPGLLSRYVRNSIFFSRIRSRVLSLYKMIFAKF